MRLYSIIFGIIGVVSMLCVGAILLFFPPQAARTYELIILTLSLALFFLSLLTLLGLFLRRRHVTDKNKENIFSMSLREAALLTTLIILLAWLARFDAVSVWAVGVAILAAAAIEYYFLTRTGSENND